MLNNKLYQNSEMMNDALAEILKSTDRNGYKSQRGEILIQVLALKFMMKSIIILGYSFILKRWKNYNSIMMLQLLIFLMIKKLKRC